MGKCIMPQNNMIGMITGLILLAAVLAMIGSFDALARMLRVPLVDEMDFNMSRTNDPPHRGTLGASKFHDPQRDRPG
jgi:hypothetical protein